MGRQGLRILSAPSITPPALTAEPGTASFASIRINPRTRFLTGPPKLAPYKVNVHQDGLPTITVDGSMQQEGLIPPWLLPAIIGLAALLLVLAILWFVVLKPSISSAAKDAVAPQTSSLQQQVNTLKAANPAPATGGGGATGPNPVKGDVWSSRLAVNSQATPAQLESVITVPQGGGLAVTDLVFENPSGNSGTIYLVRRETNKPDQVLLVLRLENFRDLDFHFVTPLVFKESQTMTLSCSPDPAGSLCNASVYYSGYFKNPPSS